jgi:hypothetical protein
MREVNFDSKTLLKKPIQLKLSEQLSLLTEAGSQHSSVINVADQMK